MDSLHVLAEQWMALDPDPANRDLVARWLQDEAAELDRCFGDSLRFGTAGLRGPLGPGPGRMNEVTVVRAAVALMTQWPGADVVIGFDARHGSRRFAEATARVVANLGGRPRLFSAPTPTPVLAFAIRHWGCDLGIMVTASHNPPGDNGYKVYLADGAQLVPPVDREIERRMQAIELPALADHLGSGEVAGAVVDVAEITGAYLDAVVPEADVGHPRVAYTPLHGVGWVTFEQALARVGAAAVAVAEQADPDPDFPTVAFPNPEEPGALDRLLELASDIGADLALAHDPDADRLAAAVPLSERWRVLSGDELGVLLADHLLETTTGDDRLVVTTVVSSRMLSVLAAAHGVRYRETLTGFKWVMRPAIEGEGRFLFGYEEALGYAVHPAVRDKDGISAGLTLLAAHRRLARAQRSLLDRLDELAVAHGLFGTSQRTVTFHTGDADDAMAGAMQRLRSRPPATVAGQAVRETTDFIAGHRGMVADLVRFDLTDGSRILVRPSGTEPKLKIYVETHQHADGADLGALRRAAGAKRQALLEYTVALLG